MNKLSRALLIRMEWKEACITGTGSRGGPQHEYLRQVGRRLALAKGFRDEQIFNEVEVCLPFNQSIFIDVVALDGDKSLAIEVGDTSMKRLQQGSVKSSGDCEDC